MSVDAIVKQAEALPPEERAEVIRRLELSLVEAGWEPGVELSDGMKALLDERDAAYEADPTDVYTWEQVVEYVRRKKLAL